MSSESHGLGSCKCKDHRSSTSYKITRLRAIEKIKSYLYSKRIGERGYTVELDWLDKTIKELEKLENDNLIQNY